MHSGDPLGLKGGHPCFRPLFVLTAASLLHPAALAATAGPSGPLEEVVVSARYLDEDVQDLPFSVSVVNGELLERTRQLSMEDLLRSSVGVDVSSFGGFNDTNVKVRGVGSLFQISSEDSSVVMNVDGVPLSVRSGTLANMDIERVEILKGPQGTLFGRNSEAGAINVTTRRPTEQTEGYLRVSAGEEGQYEVEGAIGGSLSETFAARMALRAAGADGVVYSTQNDEPVLEPEDKGWRGSLQWEPGSNTRLLLIAEQQDQEGRTGLEVLRPYGEPPSQDITPGLQFGDNDQARYSLEINHEFSRFGFTSLTSQTLDDSESRGCQSAELAFALYGYPAEICQDIASEYDTLNQDLRLTSLDTSSFFWVVGVNANKIDRRYDNGIAAFGTSADRTYETRSAAVYGEVTIPFAEQWSVTAGSRFTTEDKDYLGDFFSFGVPTGSDERELSDDYWTGRLALSYAPTDQVNLYGVVARGYKSGGFTDYTSQVADGEPLKPAIVDSFEVGLKSSHAGGQLVFNAAAFFNVVEDDHLLGYDAATFAAQGLNTDTESKGVEMDGTWTPNEQWAVTLGIAYTDAEITSTVLGASGGDVEAGNAIPDVAPWSALSRVNYTLPLPGLTWLQSPELDVLLSYRYLDSRPNDPQNHLDIDANQKLDLQVMLHGETLGFSVWGDNLLDERNDLYAYYYGPGLTTGSPSRGRTLGVSLSYQF